MIKEKLEKEATEFEENYTVYEVAKKKDGTDYAKKVCMVTVKEAYLAGAEPREKLIDELKKQIEKMKNCNNCKHYHNETYDCRDYCDFEDVCKNHEKWEIKEK